MTSKRWASTAPHNAAEQSAELPVVMSAPAGTSPDGPHVIDDLSIAIEQEPGQQDGVPSAEAVWVGGVRRTVAKRLNAAGLVVLLDDALLLVSELLTNAFQHGAGRRVGFRMVIGVDAVVIEVDDGSPNRPEVRTAGPDDENGRGMFLVDVLADSWGVSEDGTRTWCTLSTPFRAVTGRSPTGQGQEEDPP